MAQDYGTMKRRILRELNRSDLTSDASRAVHTAIEFYADRRFWFNEERWDASTSAGQQYYPMPAGFRDIDELSVHINQNDYLLFRRHWQDIEDFSVSPNTYTGYPTDYAVQRNELRLYPAPNDSYKMTMTGLTNLAELSSDSVSNAWMTYGEEMIRSRACVDLIENLLQDYDEPRSQLYRRREMEAFQNLKMESNRRIATGKSRKARW